MIVRDVTKLAKASELNQLAVKDEPGTIRGYLNLGILEIHKRFALLQQTATVTLAADTVQYTLDDSDPNVDMNLRGNQYLMVESVYDENNNFIPVDKEKDTFSIKTPSYNTIEVPEDLLKTITTLKVHYRAAPSFITSDAASVPLPAQFLEPLLYYIGYKGHCSVQAGTQFEDSTYYKRFLKSCADIKLNGLYIDSSLETDKFEKRGFV